VDENEDEENEDDDEEEEDDEEIVHGHAEAMIFRRKRSNASTQQGVRDNFYIGPVSQCIFVELMF